MTVLNALQLFLLGLITLVIGVPAILVSLLLPGKTARGRWFRIVSKTYSRIYRNSGRIDPVLQCYFDAFL